MGREHPWECEHGVLMGGDESFGQQDNHCYECVKFNDYTGERIMSGTEELSDKEDGRMFKFFKKTLFEDGRYLFSPLKFLIIALILIGAKEFVMNRTQNSVSKMMEVCHESDVLLVDTVFTINTGVFFNTATITCRFTKKGSAKLHTKRGNV